MLSGHLFTPLPEPAPDEIIDALFARGDVRIERIVSTGQSSPPDFWYDQAESEFVVLLSGAATLQFEGDAAPLQLTPGSYVAIPPHRRHRVEATQADPPTIWLAVFCP